MQTSTQWTKPEWATPAHRDNRCFNGRAEDDFLHSMDGLKVKNSWFSRDDADADAHEAKKAFQQNMDAKKEQHEVWKEQNKEQNQAKLMRKQEQARIEREIAQLKAKLAAAQGTRTAEPIEEQPTSQEDSAPLRCPEVEKAVQAQSDEGCQERMDDLKQEHAWEKPNWTANANDGNQLSQPLSNLSVERMDELKKQHAWTKPEWALPEKDVAPDESGVLKESIENPLLKPNQDGYVRKVKPTDQMEFVEGRFLKDGTTW